MQDINPRVDIAFKKIFGVEENKDLLISLVNSIVSAEDQVADLILINPYNQKNFKTDKLSILDIKAKGLDGKRFNIEIQISDEGDYDKRALYYWSKLYTEQLKQSYGYLGLAKTIGIHILNFTSIPESDSYHNVFHIREKDKGIHYFSDLELHTIELKKFIDSVSNDLSEIVTKIKTSLDLWVTFLTKCNLLDKDNLPKSLEKKELKKALHTLEVLNFSDEEREEYDNHHKWLQIQASTILKAQREAKAEGFLEGEAIGIEKGIEKVAIAMLKANLPIDSIAAMTGLSTELIAQFTTKL